MPWFRVDDSFPTHPKVLRIPRKERAAAVGLWALAGGWCADQLTDGHLGEHMLTEFASSKKYAEALVDAGLWEKTDSGYLFHDWPDWNPTKAQVEADREAARERMRKARERRSSPEHTANEQRSSPDVRLTPSRPDPTLSSSGTTSEPRQRGTRIPDPFIVNEAMAAWAQERGYHPAFVNQETEKFINHFTAKAGRDATKMDWRAAWKNWLIKSATDFAPRRQNGTADEHHERYMQRLAQQEAAG